MEGKAAPHRVEESRPEESQARVLLRRFTANRAAVVGLALVVVLGVVAVLARRLAPFDPVEAFRDGLSPIGAPIAPNGKYLLGTDQMGRDLLSRLIFGVQVSLKVGTVALLISLFLGTVLGVLAGYWGGWVDAVIMRVTDVMLAFPFLLFSILLVSILRPSLGVIYVVMGVLGWANVARIVRGQVLQVMRMSYVDAARMMCASPLRIALHHVLPNILGPVVVFGTVQVGNYILMEGSLSFLGVGVPPPTPSLGSMIFEGKQYFMAAPWMILYPGLLLSALVIGFNLLGDGLSDVLIPHHDD